MAVPTWGDHPASESTDGSTDTWTAQVVNGGNITVRYPPSIAADDIAFMLGFTTSTASDTLLEPAGWTACGGSVTITSSSSAGTVRLFWRRCVGDEDGTTFTLDCDDSSNATTVARVGAIWTVAGAVASGTPFEDYDTTMAEGASMSSPDTTTLGTDRLLMRVFAIPELSAAPTDTPAGWTAQFTGRTSRGDDFGFAVDTKDAAAQDTYAASARATPGASYGAAVFAFAVKPADGGGSAIVNKISGPFGGPFRKLI